MKCERIQEIILTDYLDGELSGELVKVVDGHLSGCAGCREFLDVAKRSAVEPFAAPQGEVLSQEGIWQKIKQEVAEESSPSVLSNPFADIFSKLRDIILLPRPALVFSVVIIAVMAGLLLNPFDHDKMVKPAPSESPEQYLAYVAEELLLSQAEDNDDYGTEIEEYFL